MDVDSLRREYERIFRDHLIPMAERNPGRPLVFLEYAAVDTVEAPAGPNIWLNDSSLVFADASGNGLDDGQEVQDNMYRALFETMEAYPGLVHGAFFSDTWIPDSEDYWSRPVMYRAYSLPWEAVRTDRPGVVRQVADDHVASVVDRWDFGMKSPLAVVPAARQRSSASAPAASPAAGVGEPVLTVGRNSRSTGESRPTGPGPLPSVAST